MLSVIKGIINLLIYLPIIGTSYLLSTGIHPRFLIVFLLSFFIYQLIFFLKGVLLSLKQKDRRLWIFLFLFCVTIVCVVGPYLLVYFLFNLLFHGFPLYWQTLLATGILGPLT